MFDPLSLENYSKACTFSILGTNLDSTI
jgi:hypothetical protein